MGFVSLLVSGVLALVGGYVAVLTALGTIEALHDGLNLLRRPRTIDAASPGRVKLQGSVERATTTFAAPLTDRDAVAAQVRLFEQSGLLNRLLGNWEETDCRTTVERFRLVDETGTIAVAPVSVHSKTLASLTRDGTATLDADESPTGDARDALSFLADGPAVDRRAETDDDAEGRDDEQVRARPDGGVSAHASDCPQKFTCAALTPGDEVSVLGRLERAPDGSEVITGDPNVLIFDGAPRRVAVKKGAEALALGLVTLFVTGFLYNLLAGLLA
jgi:hypothetical protein